MAFVDLAVVEITAGTGGSGLEAFRREKYVARGGPSGGDGGRGGHVILEVDPQLATLLDFSYQKKCRAERGEHGQNKNKTGRDGEDLLLKVPPGTIVRDQDTCEVLAQLIEPGQRVIAARGGRGGRGNASFATATLQAPTRWEPGEEGEHRVVELELKLIADVGLVGEPNAGKSTLLAAVSDAHPRIADYPFTTLQPNLGVVALPDFRSFVVADIPGIIEGAHEGRGLGHQFLRHVERTRTLAVLVPVDSPDPQAEYDLLRGELASYSAALAQIPHCLIMTKTDLLGPGDAPPTVAAPQAWATFTVSAVAHQGLGPLLEDLWVRTREVIREEVLEEGWWTS
ncbi:MAG TPA: GTPase ObgE [Gemmatimonadetes bacterium]|nr:GTPase ObgE [Gemmatimonadota bacterium]